MANENVLQLPQASQPLTGLEVVYAVQNDVDTQTTTAAIAALSSGGGGGGTGTLGQQNLSIKSANFAATVAQAPLIKNYQFGSAAAPGPGITTITNLTDLANNFNAFEDFTELTTINSEIQRYQPFNSINHVLNANNLTLQAANPNSDWNFTTAPTQCAGFTAGAATPIANLGLANTSSIQVGQMCAVQGGGNVGGNYWITAIVPNVSVTLSTLNGSPGTQVSTGLIFWLPVFGAQLSSPCNVGATTMNFSSLPAGVVNGMAFGVYNAPSGGVTLNRDEDYRVTNITGGLVTFNPPRGNVGNLGTNSLIWFLPVVTSGQIWSQLQYDLTNPQTFLAFEADLTLVPNGLTKTTLGANGELTVAQWATIPTNMPMGAWPAFWQYSADDGNSNAETGGASEIDIVEIQIGCTQDGSYMNTGAVSYTGAATLFQKSDSGWGLFAAFGISIAPAGTFFLGRNLYQWIFSNGVEYRFFNGILYKAREFQWTNQRPTQFSVGIACGGLTAPLTANTTFPNSPSGIANIQAAINGIRIWRTPPPGGA